MWPFKKSIGVKDLDERLERLERRFLALVEEWDDAFDRIRRAENRIAKRKAAVAESDLPVGTDAAPELVPEQMGPRRALTPRQLALQAQILRNRQGVG